MHFSPPSRSEPFSGFQLKLASESETAHQIRAELRASGVFAVNLMGGMGSGKSSLILAAAKRLPDYRIAVITADPFAKCDASAHLKSIRFFLPINPGPSSLVRAGHVQMAMNKCDLNKLDLVLIENVSGFNGTCTIDLGESAKVSVFSVAAGDGRAAGFSGAIRCSDLVVLNKIDMFSIMPFDLPGFRADVGRLNAAAGFIVLSTLTSKGLDQWGGWLESRILETRQNRG